MQKTGILKHFLFLILTCLSISCYSQFRKIRLNTSVGFGFLTGRIQSDLSEDVEKHFKKLKFGNLYEVDLGYEVNDVWGFGLFFSNLHSDDRANFDGGFFEEALVGTSVDVDSEVELNYMAPKLYFFLSEDYDKHQLVGNFSIGYLRYENNSLYNGGTSRSVSANTLGLGVGLDYEYKITPFVYFNSRFTALVSFVSEFDVKDVNGERKVSASDFTNGDRDRENLGYIGLTVGVRVDIDKPKKEGEYGAVNDSASFERKKLKEIKGLKQLRKKEVRDIKKLRNRQIKELRKKTAS